MVFAQKKNPDIFWASLQRIPSKKDYPLCTNIIVKSHSLTPISNLRFRVGPVASTTLHATNKNISCHDHLWPDVVFTCIRYKTTRLLCTLKSTMDNWSFGPNQDRGCIFWWKLVDLMGNHIEHTVPKVVSEDHLSLICRRKSEARTEGTNIPKAGSQNSFSCRTVWEWFKNSRLRVWVAVE